MDEKKITVELVFREVKEDEDYSFLELSKIKRVKSKTTLTDDEIDRLGEEIAQTDQWQVDRWNYLQAVLGDSEVTSIKIK